MSRFETSLGLCGLSRADAAQFFDVSPETVKSWCQGRRNVPNGVWQTLAALYDQIDEIAQHALDTFEGAEVDEALLQAMAKLEQGDKLPKPALDAAVAMYLLTRLHQ